MMTDKKLSELDALNDFSPLGDYFYVVRGGVSYRVRGDLLQRPELDELRSLIEGGLSGGADIYEDAAAGLAATSEGEFFSTPYDRDWETITKW